MPKINRIRLANIQYDNGKKQIPHLMLNLAGEDSLVLLGNGGGKTLLFQLILQTILPNERLGNRKISDLLQSQKFTGHVVVEWLLDSTGEQDHYLCTGFCFSHATQQDSG
jgi:ABC-type Mn2+/Zn2+ transport system ATPase subunit